MTCIPAICPPSSFIQAFCVGEMDNQLDNLGSNSLLAWIHQLIYRELPQSIQGQVYANQILRFVAPVFAPESKVLPFVPLPELCCRANTGQAQWSRPVVAAWSLLLLAARLLDDIEDQVAKDDAPITINTITGLHFVIQLMLGELMKMPETAASFHPILFGLNRTMLNACAGQHADLEHNRLYQKEIDPDAWFEIARAKSGEFFAWAAWAGARVANAPENVLACCWTFGVCLGTLLQIADDFNDVWLSPRLSDLTTGALSLPVIYARFVSDKATQTHIDQLLSQAQSGDRDAEEMIRKILIEIGAQNYLLVAARAEYLQAVAALEQINSTDESGQALLALLDQILPAISSDSLK